MNVYTKASVLLRGLFRQGHVNARLKVVFYAQCACVRACLRQREREGQRGKETDKQRESLPRLFVCLLVCFSTSNRLVKLRLQTLLYQDPESSNDGIIRAAMLLVVVVSYQQLYLCREAGQTSQHFQQSPTVKQEQPIMPTSVPCLSAPG